MAKVSLLPASWDLPATFRQRLGDTAGKQRLMQADGHRPTRYEMSLFEPSDWEALRTAVAERGSVGFRSRLAELEADRVILEGGPPA